jgi:hypothetical protein
VDEIHARHKPVVDPVVFAGDDHIGGEVVEEIKVAVAVARGSSQISMEVISPLQGMGAKRNHEWQWH